MSAHPSTVPVATGRTPAATGGAATRPNAVLALALVLALAGAAVAVQALVGVLGAPPAMGDPVRTSAGTVTVTRAASTFVPDTQGPPSAAQHAGTAGTWQMQVWVRVANEDPAESLTFRADGLRLVVGSQDGEPLDAEGSSVGQLTLPPGAAVDGQVWFDVPAAAGDLTAGSWLSLDDPRGGDTLVPLSPSQVTVPAHDHSEDDGHTDHEHG